MRSWLLRECRWAVSGESVRKLCEQGELSVAFEALGVLVRADGSICKSLVCTFLKQCVAKGDLALGRRMHAFTVRMGYQEDTFLGNHILRMYASHGRLQEAMDVFTFLAEPDAFMWSTMISAHVKWGQDKLAVHLYRGMRRSNVRPNGQVFVAALRACAKGKDLKAGKEVHADVLASGLERDLFVCSGVVDMYAKCGSVVNARRVFDGLARKDVVTWNAMMAGYAHQGMGQEALRLYSAMQRGGITEPTLVTFVCLLQACASSDALALEMGMQLHAQIRARGFQADVVVGGSLVNMYAKCGNLEEARGVFDGLGLKNVATWNAMIAAYSQQGMGQESLHLYRNMQEEGILAPDGVTFLCLLQGCASVGTPALEQGKQLHAQIRERGLEADVFVASSLLDMYIKCDSLEEARGVFDGLGHKNVVTWSAMIAGYSQHDMGLEALRLFRLMQDEAITAPNSVTYVCILQACASVGCAALEKGKEIHVQTRERGLQADVLVASSLVDMYARCGSLEKAQAVFDRLGLRNVVTWNAMIAGYSQQGMGQEALEIYNAMQEEGLVAPNALTFVHLLQACSSIAALHLGKQLHAEIRDHGFQSDSLVASGLINMFGRCGSMPDAQEVFEAWPGRKEVGAWNSLIAGYTRQGDSEKVFNLVLRMREDGVVPDGITLLSVLNVCSHTGLVNKGREHFQAMTRNHSITPTAEHYSCMVDLLARAGQLDEALAFVGSMPVLPNSSVWHTLLGGCRKWRNVKVGRHAFDEAVKLDKTDAAAYTLMENIYTDAQMRKQAEKLQVSRIRQRAWKRPGRSWWTDTSGQVHSFLAENMDQGLQDVRVSSWSRVGNKAKNSPPDLDGIGAA